MSHRFSAYPYAMQVGCPNKNKTRQKRGQTQKNVQQQHPGYFYMINNKKIIWHGHKWMAQNQRRLSKKLFEIYTSDTTSLMKN
jgi:hypothetical protein